MLSAINLSVLMTGFVMGFDGRYRPSSQSMSDPPRSRTTLSLVVLFPPPVSVLPYPLGTHWTSHVRSDFWKTAGKMTSSHLQHLEAFLLECELLM